MGVRERRNRCSGKSEMSVREKPKQVFGNFRNGCSVWAEIFSSLHSKEKMNSSPNGIGGVELKKEDVVYAKPNEDAGNVAEFKK